MKYFNALPPSITILHINQLLGPYSRLCLLNSPIHTQPDHPLPRCPSLRSGWQPPSSFSSQCEANKIKALPPSCHLELLQLVINSLLNKSDSLLTIDLAAK